MAHKKTDIKSYSFEELADYLKARGLPQFRAKQIFDWLHAKQAVSFEEMTNLPKTLIASLNEDAFIAVHTIEKKLVSQADGTVKYLFRLPDGEFCATFPVRGLAFCGESRRFGLRRKRSFPACQRFNTGF